jgi:hypothetical protein
MLKIRDIRHRHRHYLVLVLDLVPEMVLALGLVLVLALVLDLELDPVLVLDFRMYHHLYLLPYFHLCLPHQGIPDLQ